MGSAAAANAATPEVRYSPLDLADGEIALPSEFANIGSLSSAIVEFTPGTPSPNCELDVSDGKLVSAGPGSCPAIWAMPSTVMLSFTLRDREAGDAAPAIPIRLVPNRVGAPSRLSLDIAGAAIVAPPDFPSGITEVAVLMYDGSGDNVRPLAWERRTIQAGRVTLDGPTVLAARRRSGLYMAYASGPGTQSDQVWEWQVLASNASTRSTTLASAPSRPTVMVTTPSAPATTAGTAVVDQSIPELQCPPKDLPHKDPIVVCIDATSGVLTYKLVPDGARLAKPNRYFYVHVLHYTDQIVKIDLGGQIGSWVPGSRGRLAARLPGGGFNLGGDEPAPQVTATTRTFAPRRPGFAPLKAQLETLDGRQLGEPLVVEFWIDETYSGAFRMGIAGVFLGGIEQEYTRATRPNSQQSEIVAGDSNFMDLDLVIGYSPYLDSGGRPATGCDNAPFCFEPYFGLGVLSTDGDGDLTWLKSIHIGAEWELTNAFAVALTANLRRVQRLASGLDVGSPIDGEIPTENKFVFGMGVVINLSPSFFKIGAGAATGLL